MEDKVLERMIDRFFDADLTVEEERELCSYLRDNDVPDRLCKDKEAVLALCAESEPVGLPAGAEARLVAMIDAIDSLEHPVVASDDKERDKERKIYKIPRPVWYGVAVAASMAIFFYIMSSSVESPVTVSKTPVVANVEMVEQDTFDEPEEAMLCAKESLGKILLAMNDAQNSLEGIENDFARVARQRNKSMKNNSKR